MDADELLGIESRCKNVINGFKQPGQQDVRNAMRLIRFVDQPQTRAADEAVNATNSNLPHAESFNNLFADIFGRRPA